MMKMEAVIFDMDGVLVDSEPLQVESFNEILQSYNIRISQTEFKRFVGRTQKEIFSELKEIYQIGESVESLIAKKRIQYLRLVNSKLTAMPGLLDLIALLKEKKIKIGVASSSPLMDIEMVLQRIELDQQFDAVLSAFNLPKGKPDPEVFLRTANVLEVQPSHCMVIEDTAVGVLAAKRAKMSCIAMPNFFTREQDFQLADYIADNMVEVKTILQELSEYEELSFTRVASLV